MKTSILVHNLKCGGCASTISSKLSKIDSISDIEIVVEDSKISFNHIKETDVIVVKNSLKTLGYPSVDDDNSLASKAKSFVSCATGKFSK